MTSSFEYVLDPLLFEEGRLLAMEGFTGFTAPRSRGGIGVLGEKSVHRVLKYCCSPAADGQEVPIGGYVADVVGEEGIIEIQTAHFERLRDKLAAFLPCCPVTVVWPAEAEKWLCTVDPATGELLSRRKSPLHQRPVDIFAELYRLKSLLASPGLRFCIALLETEEYRYRLPKGRRRTVRCDRIPLKLLGQVCLSVPSDYLALLPDGLPEVFGAKETAALGKMSGNLARMMLNVMEAVGALAPAGKDGRRKLFIRNREDLA